MTAPALSPKATRLLAALPATPDAYPQKLDLDRRLVLTIRMDEQAYRTASFLDDRVLGPSTEGAWLPEPAVLDAAMLAEPRPMHFIFHTGHVGSTLLSRLLDEIGCVLSLREPLPLRTLADARDAAVDPETAVEVARLQRLTDTFLRLWSRGYETTCAVIVKATSSAGKIAAPLLSAAPGARAVYLNLGAEPYLAALLAGANSAVDLQGHAPGRMRRLLARSPALGGAAVRLSLGELAALGWLVETLSCRDAIRAHPAKVLPLDFDAFLSDVGAGLARVLAHFDLPSDPALVSRIVGGPVLRHYSKATSERFTPEDRAAEIRRSRRENHDLIARGMAWLDRVASLDGSLAPLRSGAAA